MLRKKLSKLIVGVMTVAMLSGGIGVGQAAFASSNAGVVATQATGVNVADAAAMENELKTNANVELKLNVTGTINLTQGIIDSINSRTQPLTIEVANGGQLVIGAGFAQAVTLGSNDVNFDLTIVRGTGKTGVMLNQNSTVDVLIQNINFDNNGQAESAFGTDGKFKTTLRGNKLVGSVVNENSSLVEQTVSTNFQNLVFDRNVLNTGKLLSDQTLVVNFANAPESTVINFSGNIDGTKETNVNIKSGTATISVMDPSNPTNVKEVSVKLNVTPNNGVFTGATFSTFVGSLVQNKQYDVQLVIEVLDDGNNEYVRVQNTKVTTKQDNFSSSVTNIGNNSATININHGDFPTVNPNRYPLTLTINGVSYSIDKNMTSVNVTGLASGTRYSYEIKSGATVINTGAFTTTSSTITGGGSTGGSVTSGDITTSDINRADIKDISVSIPVGSTTLANSLRDGRDYKTNIEGVTVTYSNGKVEFTGLVPEKDYRDLTITYTDKDGRTRTVKVPSFKTKVSETKLRQFIVDVYRYSLDRVADERGFAYWEDQLKNKKTSPDEFVKNLLNEREFINKHTTTTAKIEGLYQVIVNRKSDSQGLSYWTKKYDDLVKKGYSESMALNVIVDEMVNEQEFKNRVRDLGL